MFRRCVCIAPAVVLVGLSTAHAADTTLTLACEGTATVGTMGDAKPEPVSMGIIVNFTKQTVHGFGYPGLTDYPVNITGANEVTVAFVGRRDRGFSKDSTMGSIDRVTGDLEATLTTTDSKTGKTITSTSYALKCRPAQRMF